jgi:predicted RNase H-like HicB family nuclease
MKQYRLTAIIWKETEGYVSKCPELGVASAGNSPSQALVNLKEATELYLENAKQLGLLDDLADTLMVEERFTSVLEVRAS